MEEQETDHESLTWVEYSAGKGTLEPRPKHGVTITAE
jgi:hypothetical protein